MEPIRKWSNLKGEDKNNWISESFVSKTSKHHSSIFDSVKRLS